MRHAAAQAGENILADLDADDVEAEVGEDRRERQPDIA
jgi:hypothetical protein